MLAYRSLINRQFSPFGTAQKRFGLIFISTHFRWLINRVAIVRDGARCGVVLLDESGGVQSMH
jgi:hypothetical protein